MPFSLCLILLWNLDFALIPINNCLKFQITIIGNYTCECNEGFDEDLDGFCNDIDECLTDVCPDLNDSCENTVGSYQCVCNNGYIFKNNVCEDIDECLTSEFNCTENSSCENTVGSYECLCNEGKTYFMYPECTIFVC